MEYKLLWNMNSSSLSNEVNDDLKSGWELYGHPFCSEHVIYQAMIKRKSVDPFDFGPS